MNAETQKKLDQIKLWMSHQNPDLSTAKLFEILVDQEFKKLSKQRESKTTSAPEPAIPSAETNLTSAAEVKTASRFISAETKRAVYQRDQGCCQYRNSQTGEQCRSKYQIQFDHIIRFRDGGSCDKENIRLMCARHNRLRG